MTDLELAQSLGLVNNGVEMEVSDDKVIWKKETIGAYAPQLNCAYPWRLCSTSKDTGWRYARPIPAKRMRPMTHADVFRAIREGAVVRHDGTPKSPYIANVWDSSRDVLDFEICYSYTGTDADVWEPMEKEVEG